MGHNLIWTIYKIMILAYLKILFTSDFLGLDWPLNYYLPQTYKIYSYYHTNIIGLWLKFISNISTSQILSRSFLSSPAIKLIFLTLIFYFLILVLKHSKPVLLVSAKVCKSFITNKKHRRDGKNDKVWTTLQYSTSQSHHKTRWSDWLVKSNLRYDINLIKNS